MELGSCLAFSQTLHVVPLNTVRLHTCLPSSHTLLLLCASAISGKACEQVTNEDGKAEKAKGDTGQAQSGFPYHNNILFPIIVVIMLAGFT